MPDYSKGQIYKICDIGFNQCYIGSSVEKLYNRMAKHRYEYKKYQEGKTTNYCYVYRLFDSYGVNNCKIYWIEDYPCNSKKELEAREGYYQQNTDCVNKQIAGRSKEQWTEDNKEKLKIQAKERYEKNKETVNEKRRERYKHSKEKEQQQQKLYKLQKITCECGSVIQKHEEKTISRQTSTNNTYKVKPTHKNKSSYNFLNIENIKKIISTLIYVNISS